MITELVKKHNHSHFWVEDNVVYESYNTIIGKRYMSVVEVEMEDNGNLTDDDIEYVNMKIKENVC